MAYVRQNQFRAPNGRTIFDWITGTGFLAVDAGAFFVALMVLLPWNLYRSPGDLWVAQPLRTWAFVLTFHALAVGAIALARGIVRSPEPERAAPRPGLRASSGWSTSPAPQQRGQTASTLVAQEWARRWLEDDRAEAADLLQQSRTISSRDGFDTPAGHNAETTPWPEAPAPRAPIDAEVILADWLDEQASAYVAPVRHPIDPLRSAARVTEAATGQEDDAALDPDLEWKWVEAAATAWLSRHENQNGDHHISDGHA